MPTESRATRSVFRSLQREREGSLWSQVGEQFPTDSEADFTESAKAWLGDRSNLGTKTLEEANWPEIYQHFKALREAE